MATRPLRRLGKKPLLRSEDIDTVVSEMQAAMERVSAEFIASTRVSGDGSADLPPAPDLQELAEASLRAYLEDEIVELEPVEGNDIQRVEIEHEVMKKALVGLKLAGLREVAALRGIASAGSSDELAQRVASSYGWDEAAIARLVLDHTGEPIETENGPSTRIFLLRHPANLDAIEERLAYVTGRYIRTGTARWFVFEDYSRLSDEALELEGSLRTYRPRIEDEGNEASLRADRTISPARLEVTDGSRFVLVHGAASVGAAKAMMSAFTVATAQEVLPYVPNAEAGAKARSRALHPITLFLLDLVTSGMQGHLFRQRNAILARFRVAKSAAEPDPESSPKITRRPRLSAVRFEGDYLLDSPAACRLMWTDGRPLVDLTMRVVTTDPGDTTPRATFAVRLAVENDHVLVAMGLGDGDSKRAAAVHAAAIRAVARQVEAGVDLSRADALNRIVREQAESPEDSAEARLLTDDIEMI